MILKYFIPDDKNSLIKFVSMHIDLYHVEETCPIFFVLLVLAECMPFAGNVKLNT